jgi:two-component system, NtrC family, response regulator
MTKRVLIVDDDSGIVRSLSWAFKDYDVLTAMDRASAVALVEEHRPPVVTLDLGLPPDPDGASEGLATLGAILTVAPETKVIMVTGNSDRRHAIQAIGQGAYDFYQKPIDPEILGLIVQRAFIVYELEQENRRLNRLDGNPLQNIVTTDDAMIAVCETVRKVASSDISILLTGASGTGKELLARALHDCSERRGGPFVPINCAAIPEALLESELFGHERGAFTGAVRQVKGKIELAHRGTLFLDEIGDMPMALQPKLLRFTEERVIERIGGRDRIPVDLRIVCATHRDLATRIEANDFREDLYYRLAEVTVRIPGLAERGNDSLVLAQHFVDLFARQSKKGRLRLGADAVEAIRRHLWPGNVRELENRLRRAVILAASTTIAARDLDLADPVMAPDAGDPPAPSFRNARDEAGRTALIQALTETKGNLSAAARLLGVSRPTIYNLIRQHNLRLPS